MPTPERTSLDRIVAAARGLVETRGVDAVTMQAVAESVGVRAPSLYKRVRNRDHLVGLVVDAIAQEIAGLLDAATRSAQGPERLGALARTLRRYAHEHAAAYTLLFASPAGRALSAQARDESSRAMLAVTAELVGAERSLPAARTITAWVTGFLAMELAGAFQLGGDVEVAFDYGIDLLTTALRHPPE